MADAALTTLRTATIACAGIAEPFNPDQSAEGLALVNQLRDLFTGSSATADHACAPLSSYRRPPPRPAAAGCAGPRTSGLHVPLALLRPALPAAARVYRGGRASVAGGTKWERSAVVTTSGRERVCPCTAAARMERQLRMEHGGGGRCSAQPLHRSEWRAARVWF
jgi:hypothetical protein